jgi:hypothetical protein
VVWQFLFSLLMYFQNLVDIWLELNKCFVDAAFPPGFRNKYMCEQWPLLKSLSFHLILSNLS